MSDFDPTVGVTLSNPLTGAQLAAWLNDLAPFVLSSGYGASVPSNATAGQIWSKITGGVPDPHVSDGADDFLMYTIANILGTVSADGLGENTGAIIEIGETSGTLWVKFAGGLALCAARLTNHPAGTEVWSLPVTFSDTDKMYGVGVSEATGSARMVTTAPASLSSFDVSVWTTAGPGSIAHARVFCVGFWTEEFL